MPKYARFDPAVADPKPVNGWLDTDTLTYPDPPPEDSLLVLTEDQWAAHFLNPDAWAIQGGELAPFTAVPTPAQNAVVLASEARTALSKSDQTILRCVENAVAVPDDWKSYRETLRAIVSGTSTAMALPAMPAYPAGTA